MFCLIELKIKCNCVIIRKIKDGGYVTALVPIRIYKKSILVTIISIFGTGCIAAGVFTLFEDFALAVGFIAFGIPLLFLALWINKRKIFNKWVKELKTNGVIDALSTSPEACRLIYDKNPNKMTLKLINKYNPRVAEEIKAEIATLKQK